MIFVRPPRPPASPEHVNRRADIILMQLALSNSSVHTLRGYHYRAPVEGNSDPRDKILLVPKPCLV